MSDWTISEADLRRAVAAYKHKLADSGRVGEPTITGELALGRLPDVELTPAGARALLLWREANPR